MYIYIVFALMVLNITGLITVFVDKRKAIKKRWRIPEKAFFFLALLGASLGVYTGMLLFRHKTRHWYFMLGIPFIFILQLAAAYIIKVQIAG